MDILKVKFEFNGLKFEIEGREQIVREEFKDFKDFTQSLAAKVNFVTIAETIEQQKVDMPLLTDAEVESENEFPVLKEVVMKKLPGSEVEWILIYAFYESNYGQNGFTRESLIEKYKETERNNKSTIGHFADNFKSILTKDFIKVINDDEYKLTSKGIERVKEILHTKKAVNSSKAKVSSTVKRNEQKENKVIKQAFPSILKDLNLRPDGHISLKDYAKQYDVKGAEELYLVIVYYLKEILGEENVSVNHIFTGLIELDKKVPTHLKQVLVNLRNNNSSNHWLILDDLDNINYSIRGMNHLKHDIKRSKIDE
jgi:hypothetical protein